MKEVNHPKSGHIASVIRSQKEVGASEKLRIEDSSMFANNIPKYSLEWYLKVTGIVNNIATVLVFICLVATLLYTKQATDATKANLHVAEENLRIAEGNAQAELRAYVSFGNLRFIRLGPNTKSGSPDVLFSVSIIFDLTNAGVTPGYNLEYATRSENSSGGINYYDDFIELGTIASGQTLVANSELPISKETYDDFTNFLLINGSDIEDWKSVTPVIYLTFVLKYKDVYNRTIRNQVHGSISTYSLLSKLEFQNEEIEVKFSIQDNPSLNGETIMEPVQGRYVWDIHLLRNMECHPHELPSNQESDSSFVD